MKIKKYLFLFILIVLLLPIIQQVTNIVILNKLKGDVKYTNDSTYTITRWLNNTYQENKEKTLNEKFGFRNFFIRLNNQIAYSFFTKVKANGVIVGKENYLYEENYLKAISGKDFIGIDSTKKRFDKLKVLSDTLTKLNKQLILVYAAGKGTYYQEYVPDFYSKKTNETNYFTHLKYAKEYALNYIDFNKWFLDNKFKSKYPLYPKNGIHWSQYGMCLVADSLIKYIEFKRNIDMPNIYWDEIEFNVKNEMNNSDNDIAEGLNKFFKPTNGKMAYPKVKFESSENKTKPKVLVVSDSFYWGLFGYGISTNSFNNGHFWYYNQQVYPENYTSGLITDDLNTLKEIMNHDVIIILATEATLPNFGWGFIEKAYYEFSVSSLNNFKISKVYKEKVKNLIQYIKSDEPWMEGVRKIAQEKGISIDSALIKSATWVIDQEFNKK